MQANKKISLFLTALMAVNSTLPCTVFAAEEEEVPTVYSEKITLKGTSAEKEGDFEGVVIAENSITITQSGSYYFTGEYEGQIILNVNKTTYPDTTKIYLDGVNITSANGPAIYTYCAEKTSIHSMDESVNTLADGGLYSTNTNAVVYAKDDLTFKGHGKLNIQSTYQDGIFCENDLKINNTELTVSTRREDETYEDCDAIVAKDTLEIKDGIVNIDSDGDGLKSKKNNVNISGGTVKIKASNDAIQAETGIEISGGITSACGDRGLRCDVENSVIISGGTILATAVDYQVNSMKNDLGEISAFSQISSESINYLMLNLAEELAKNQTLTWADQAIETEKKCNYLFLASDSLQDLSETALFANGGAFSLNGNTTFALNQAWEGVVLEAGIEILLGDVNDDGIIDSDDAVLCLKEANAEMMGDQYLTDTQLQVADFNQDGAIDSDDCVAIMKYANEQMLG